MQWCSYWCPQGTLLFLGHFSHTNTPCTTVQDLKADTDIYLTVGHMLHTLYKIHQISVFWIVFKVSVSRNVQKHSMISKLVFTNVDTLAPLETQSHCSL